MSDLSNYTDQTKPSVNPEQISPNTSGVIPHTHNGVDSPLIDANANNQLVSLIGDVSGGSGVAITTTLATVNSNVGSFGSSTQIPSFTVNGKGLITAASNNAFSLTAITVTVTAGETLVAGDVVRLYLAVGSAASDGYQMSTGAVYACRASADDTTYGPNVVGVATQSIAYLSTGLIAIAGKASGFSALTGALDYYLANHAGASTATITQSSQDAEQQLSAGVTVTQFLIPTSSRLDKIKVKARKNGGGACVITCQVKRGNTQIASLGVSFGSNSSTLADTTYDFTDFQTYKGELLTLNFTSDTGFGYVGYESVGTPYNATYAPDGTKTWISGPSNTGTGTISSVGTAVTGVSTVFTTQLAVGQCITASGQVKVISVITDDTHLTVASAFSPDVSGVAFVYGVPTSNAGLYFTLNEFTGFGTVAGSAGTRGFRIGESASATDIYLAIQKASAIF